VTKKRRKAERRIEKDQKVKKQLDGRPSLSIKKEAPPSEVDVRKTDEKLEVWGRNLASGTTNDHYYMRIVNRVTKMREESRPNKKRPAFGWDRLYLPVGGGKYGNSMNRATHQGTSR